MCGPIAMMLPVDRSNEAKKITQIITYHIGKLTAYGTLGLIFGLLGMSKCGLDSEIEISKSNF